MIFGIVLSKKKSGSPAFLPSVSSRLKSMLGHFFLFVIVKQQRTSLFSVCPHNDNELCPNIFKI